MIDWTEIPDGDTWELFARDFLQSLGLVIQVEPGRGPDGGRDIIAIERTRGTLSDRSIRWLVSCKHYAGSGNAVGVGDEGDLIDRLAHHKADGFLGFYSTSASSGLINRFKGLEENHGKAFAIWDGRKIEGSLLNLPQAGLFIRYLPKSYSEIRPISQMLGEVIELPCEVCGRDALKDSVSGHYNANVLFGEGEDGVVRHVVVVCKGACDKRKEKQLFAQHGVITSWEDITDLCNPLIFLRRLFGIMNQQREDPAKFSDEAYEAVKQLFTALAQRTLRPALPADEERYQGQLMIEGL